jgi:two-component system alkaline phosphatase synthesis response regulator PhoP
MSDCTRILIVDDDVNLSRLMRLMLDKTRMYEVKIENRSADAVATAKAFRPGLILLDVDMPGKDGGQVARELQADSVLKYAKIIFVTALVSKNEAGMRASVRNGMRYLAKPVDPMTLIDTIEEVLGEPASVVPTP